MIKRLPSLILFLSVSCLFSATAQEKPATYSVKRYSVIWQKSMFRTPQGKVPSNDSVYWTLAGVFSYGGGKQGAVLVNRSTGEVEQIDMSDGNAKGLKLLEVSSGEAGGQPMRVKVEQKGETFWVSNQHKRLRYNHTANTESSTNTALTKVSREKGK